MRDRKIEFHFFHGFLGQVADWKMICQDLRQAFPSAGLFVWDLYDVLPSSEDWNFTSWANIMEQNLNTDARKILITYSLGGRLALHLNPDLYDEIYLLAVHPGLEQGHQERLKKDKSWAENLRQGPTSQWMHQWNQQDVFALDTVRPLRDIQGYEHFWAKVLESFSLARQQDKTEFIRDLGERAHWLVGERDLKFIRLKKKMETLLPKGHVLEVPQSGHGLVFEQPQWVARFIEKRVQDD